MKQTEHNGFFKNVQSVLENCIPVSHRTLETIRVYGF